MKSELINMTRGRDKEKSEFLVFGEVMGSIPVGDSDFCLFHARAMLISSIFTFLYRA